MPPWPSLSRLVRQRMFLLAATLHVVGAPATFTRNVPSGPPACGQLATAAGGPLSGGGISPMLASFGSAASLRGAASFGSAASFAGKPASCGGCGPLSSTGVAPLEPAFEPAFGPASAMTRGAVEHAQSRQHHAACHCETCRFFAIIVCSRLAG